MSPPLTDNKAKLAVIEKYLENRNFPLFQVDRDELLAILSGFQSKAEMDTYQHNASILTVYRLHLQDIDADGNFSFTNTRHSKPLLTGLTSDEMTRAIDFADREAQEENWTTVVVDANKELRYTAETGIGPFAVYLSCGALHNESAPVADSAMAEDFDLVEAEMYSLIQAVKVAKTAVQNLRDMISLGPDDQTLVVLVDQESRRVLWRARAL